MTALARSVLRGLARIVSRQPLLVAFAARAFALFPSLKVRTRRLLSGKAAAPTRGENLLTPEEARVLVDLQQAVARRGGRR